MSRFWIENMHVILNSPRISNVLGEMREIINKRPNALLYMHKSAGQNQNLDLKSELRNKKSN